MVSIFKKIFGDSESKSTNKSTAKKGAFQNMLEEHVRQSQQLPNQSVPDSRVGQNLQNWQQPVAPTQELPGKQSSIDDKLQNFENIESVITDPEYAQKGLKHKTLAEKFSSTVGSSLETRLDKYKHLVEMKAKKYNLDPNLLAGLIRQESNYNPYAISHCGAMGLGQLMPETARSLGVKDPFNASQNLEGAAKYLRQMMDTFGGNTDKALAAYNAGPGAVMKFGGIPPYAETQNYVKAIRSHVSQISKLDMFPKGSKKNIDVA